MNKQKNYLTQQIHSFHLKNPLMQIVKNILVCVPFSLGSICEHWIYVRVDWSSKCVLLCKHLVFTINIVFTVNMVLTIDTVLLIIWNQS